MSTRDARPPRLKPAPAAASGGRDGRRRRATGRERRPTQADVARHAEVSTATVSRALNGPEAVRPHVVARVEAAVRELGYVANGAGRALALAHTRVAGLIVPGFDDTNIARSAAAIQQRFEAAGYALLIASSDHDRGRELVQARMLVERGIEALILCGTMHDPALPELLATQRIPFVCQDALADGLPCVGFDNRAAGAALAQHLLELGHVRFATLFGRRRNDPGAADRLAGVRLALAQRGLDLAADRAAETSNDYDAARAATRDLLALAPPPTALICGNDVLAFGALRECAALGVAVPGRLSVVGCGDVDLARQAVPPLSTLRVPTMDMGRRAVEWLLRRLAGQALPDRVELSPKLVVRASTGPVSPTDHD